MQVFPGIGKTYLANKYSNVLDLESTYYAYILTEEQKQIPAEQLKGTKREKNPSWPKNYIEAIEENKNLYDIILITQHREVVLELDKMNISYTVAFPKHDCKEEYKRRFANRGNNSTFVDRIDDLYDKQIEYFIKHPSEKIILDSGEYLEDILKQRKIKLTYKEKKTCQK